MYQARVILRYVTVLWMPVGQVMLSEKVYECYVCMYYRSSIAVPSKLQSVIAASSVEAEYTAQAKCVHVALRYRKLLLDFKI